MRLVIAFLALLSACCTPPPAPAEPETTFEQQVLAIGIGMTADQVVGILGPADSTEPAEGGVEVWRWSRNFMSVRLHEPRLSGSGFRTAKVNFRKGEVSSVHYDYHLVH